MASVGAASAAAYGAVSFALFPLLGWADKRAIAQALLDDRAQRRTSGGPFER
jgi:hypothetical protein